MGKDEKISINWVWGHRVTRTTTVDGEPAIRIRNKVFRVAELQMEFTSNAIRYIYSAARPGTLPGKEVHHG